MTDNITIEQMNEEIARFMDIEGTDDFIRMNYRYEKSWDLLMPVWYKFRDLKFDEETPMKLHLNYVTRLAQDIAYGTIEEVHHNIHIAIQWYNKQQP